MSTTAWPRLSVDLPRERFLYRCQACGVLTFHHAIRWQEHDDADRPEPIIVVLCEKCSGKLIDPHPRLYRRLERHEPFPGAMPICEGCPAHDELECRSPLLKANGGPGLPLPARDGTMHIDRTVNGRRVGEWLGYWSKPAERCKGKELAIAALDGDTKAEAAS